MIYTVLELNHTSAAAGHPGPQRMLKRIQEIYIFPKMSKLVSEFTKRCKSCLLAKGAMPTPAEISRYPVGCLPLSRVHMDLLGPLKPCPNGDRYIMVFKDSLIRYVELFPLKTRQSQEAADAFIKAVIGRHGSPEVIISDQAAEYTSALFKNLCKLFKVKSVNIVSIHPSSNGLAERENQRIIGYLKHYIRSRHDNWNEHLPFCQLALNSTYVESIKNTPQTVLYAYQHRMQWDLPNYSSPFYNEKGELNIHDFHDFSSQAFSAATAIRDLARLHLEKYTDQSMRRQHENLRI